jgi:hypothetical protein
MRIALALVLTLTPVFALAAEPAKKDPPAKTGKAKAGEACKTNSDCDQSNNSQSCVNSKCEAMKVMPPT